MKNRHLKRSFMLLTVMILLSLAVVAETLATRYLIDLGRHVRERQQTIQKRVAGPAHPAFIAIPGQILR
jgi:hypothetical protein